MAFTLTSKSFNDQQALPKAHVHHAMGAGGDNVSPDLAWSGAPEGTQSYALTCYDPDAPTGSGWWHWVVYDIPATATGLALGAGATGGAALPPGTKQGRTDFGSHEYGGAAPPPRPARSTCAGRAPGRPRTSSTNTRSTSPRRSMT